MTADPSSIDLDKQGLDRALLDAHARDDGSALVGLYARAADLANDTEAAAFFLTHAYVFALETGDPASEELHCRLRALGREE
ncbi:MAG: hypothetical protein AAFU49_15175 [Pseudomonadota bacterium]